MFETNEQFLRELLRYEEFRLAFGLLRTLVIVAIGCLVVLALLHTLYFLGQRSPLYRRRAPVDGWNRRFFVMTIFLIGVLLLIAWALHLLSRGFS